MARVTILLWAMCMHLEPYYIVQYGQKWAKTLVLASWTIRDCCREFSKAFWVGKRTQLCHLWLFMAPNHELSHSMRSLISFGKSERFMPNLSPPSPPLQPPSEPPPSPQGPRTHTSAFGASLGDTLRLTNVHLSIGKHL